MKQNGMDHKFYAFLCSKFVLSILHIRIETESPYENNHLVPSPRSVPFNTQLSDRRRRLISTTSIKGGENFSHLWTEECGEVYITGAKER
ncbi:hypothetical protein TNCT_667821 [Trichonephila clavata]|uniref:Uncharacterized protein n=1 Tax=Trichonephila clavata TaxID=2740835 RepID=A0A8X6HM20_TRICU|nr:hypothetical protein TNCT_667821 [Trichonephila clavata]